MPFHSHLVSRGDLESGKLETLLSYMPLFKTYPHWKYYRPVRKSYVKNVLTVLRFCRKAKPMNEKNR